MALTCVLASTSTKRSTAMAESRIAATKRDMVWFVRVLVVGGALTASGGARLPRGPRFESQTGLKQEPSSGHRRRREDAVFRLDAATTTQGQ